MTHVHRRGRPRSRDVHESGRGQGSGIEIDGRYFNVLTVRNGKIVRKVEFTQRSDALEAAGLRE
jgi:ketosteroid isomerase-like protein